MRYRAALVFAAASALGCSANASRAWGGPYDGNGSYTAMIYGSPSGEVGALPMHVILRDTPRIDSAPNGNVIVEVTDRCSVLADITAAESAGPGSTSPAASVSTGQQCELELEGGLLVFAVSSGHIVLNGGGGLDMTLVGNVLEWNGSLTGGVFALTFRSGGSGGA